MRFFSPILNTFKKTTFDKTACSQKLVLKSYFKPLRIVFQETDKKASFEIKRRFFLIKGAVFKNNHRLFF